MRSRCISNVVTNNTQLLLRFRGFMRDKWYGDVNKDYNYKNQMEIGGSMLHLQQWVRICKITLAARM